MPVQSAPSSASRRLLSILGITFGLAVTIGNIIGAGILRTPGEIAANLPSFWPFLSVWIIGGLYALLGANALAELGTLVPRSGGQYVFVRKGLGDYAGFIVGWSDWISTCGTTAAVSITIGEYTVPLVPELRAMEVVALLIIGIFTLVQWFGVRWGGAAQNITSFLKAIAFLVLIAACLHLGGRNPLSNTFEIEREGSLLLAFILSLQAVIYTYDGWSAVIYFSEEVKDPGRNIPRSMFGGVLSVMFIYILLNIAILRVVPLATIAGEKLAVATVTQHLFGPYGYLVLQLLVIVALLSAANSNVLMAPRVLFAMSRDGLFWRGAQEVNRGGTPDVSLLLSSVMAAIIVISTSFRGAVGLLAFFFVVNYTLSFTSLFRLRVRDPHAPRPFRAWGHPYTTGLALVASVAFLIGAIVSDTKASLYSLFFLALSFPVYLLVRRRRGTHA